MKDYEEEDRLRRSYNSVGIKGITRNCRKAKSRDEIHFYMLSFFEFPQKVKLHLYMLILHEKQLRIVCYVVVKVFVRSVCAQV